ncbi:MAG TPA: FAD-dependent oxidoreductase [Chthoniobacterales bacterium]|nr:FAD-dependent oxidoreductase [Chthoniobacterales bacterium]
MATHQHQSERAGENISLWEATDEAGTLHPLTENTRADVCIVGAGISGLTIAYTLTKEGKSVVVLDDGLVGRGMTGRTTAQIVNALDDRYYELEKLHGEEGARLAAESHTAAIERVATIVREEKIECEFERLDGYLFEPPNEPAKNLRTEFEACQRAGLAVEWMERAPMAGFDSGPAIKFPNQAQFHPLLYVRGLAAAITRGGGRIFTGTRAVDVQGGDPAYVLTKDGYRVEADAIVVASNSPINDRYVIHTKQSPYMSYVIGLRVPPGSVTRALYWDTAEHAGQEDKWVGMIPYHYVRLAQEGGEEVLVVGGEDHKTGQADDFEQRYGRLEDWARVRFPSAGAVVFRWSGQVMEPVDGLAFIGRNPADKENVYIVTADSGNGMTHGTIAGILIPDLMAGRENKWATLYDPSRKSLRAGGDFAKENLNVAKQYKDLVTGGDVASADEIANGEGAVLRHGLRKVAAYRDESGTLHEMTAVCPHLKCIVHWNRSEKTWDCPCHGSRFDAMGHVMQGPSVADLAPVEAS